MTSEDEGSDWTWETCSDSDPEGVDSASISTLSAKTGKTNKTSTPSTTKTESSTTKGIL